MALSSKSLLSVWRREEAAAVVMAKDSDTKDATEDDDDEGVSVKPDARSRVSSSSWFMYSPRRVNGTHIDMPQHTPIPLTMMVASNTVETKTVHSIQKANRR